MIDISERVMELALKKYCCSQIVMEIGLEMQGKENAELVQSMKGLCYGVCTQRFCGTLAAAACMLSLYQEQHAAVIIPELIQWFENEYGSVDCSDIVGLGKSNLSLCQEIVAQTCVRCFELLEENDLMPDES